MSFARAVTVPKGFSRTVFRRVGSATRQRSWRQVGRRGYASDHGHGGQQSSEIPWIVGSAVVFFPSAAWLLGQGPTKSDHGHGEHHDEHEEKEEEEQPQEESNEEESKEESKDEGEEKAEESKSDESDKEEESSGTQTEDDEYEAPGPNAPKQINWDSSSNKGPGESQKGERKPSEKKGEKDSQGDSSGAKHPYLDDPEKSKKGVGITETAKIHGTVDPRAPARGPKGEGSSTESE